jgi:hypothetical protein
MRDLAWTQQWPGVDRIAIFTGHQIRYLLHGRHP